MRVDKILKVSIIQMKAIDCYSAALSGGAVYMLHVQSVLIDKLSELGK